jgi:AmpE protein
MKFLIVFIALFLQNNVSLPQRSTRSRSFAGWLGFWLKRPAFLSLPRHIKYVIAVLLPAALASVGFYLAEQWLWGLIALVLEVALLLYVLSHISFERHFQAYLHDLEQGDTQGAYHCAERFLAVPEVELANNAETLNLQVIKVLLHRWFEYFFLMVFWYMVADVPGVLVAWFSVQYARASECDAQAWRYLHWLEWLPVRLLGLTFGLAGNFMRALPVWQRYLWQTQASSADVLYQVASSSLTHNGEEKHWHRVDEDAGLAAKELQEWQSLHLRSMSIWMVVIAVATIGGFLL